MKSAPKQQQKNFAGFLEIIMQTNLLKKLLKTSDHLQTGKVGQRKSLQDASLTLMHSSSSGHM